MFTSLQMAYFFGILGNCVSFMVFLAPIPTFYRIYKMKSTQGFQSVPYSVSLFSCLLLLYYAFIKKKDALLLITINSFGTLVETIYLFLFMIYATKSTRIFTAKLIVVFNIGALGAIVGCTYMFVNGQTRVEVVGWICAVFSIIVFAAPLGIMRKVIKTKSVEFMPFMLSFFLTLCAIMWFFYGFLIRDYYISTPNILGVTFGIAQMILYMIYKDRKNNKNNNNNKKQLVEILTPSSSSQDSLNNSTATATNKVELVTITHVIDIIGQQQQEDHHQELVNVEPSSTPPPPPPPPVFDDTVNINPHHHQQQQQQSLN